jgi:hypothetical protein
MGEKGCATPGIALKLALGPSAAAPRDIDAEERKSFAQEDG